MLQQKTNTLSFGEEEDTIQRIFINLGFVRQPISKQLLSNIINCLSLIHGNVFSSAFSHKKILSTKTLYTYRLALNSCAKLLNANWHQLVKNYNDLSLNVTNFIDSFLNLPYRSEQQDLEEDFLLAKVAFLDNLNIEVTHLFYFKIILNLEIFLK